MSIPQNLTDEEKQNLVAYLDGELDEEAARALETKLQLSSTARAEAETLRKTWELLDYLPRPQAPASFTHQTINRLERRQLALARRSHWLRWSGAAAWLIGTVAAGWIGFMLAHQPAPTALPDPTAEELQLLEHHEYWPYYEKIDSLQFLRELSAGDLFGSES